MAYLKCYLSVTIHLYYENLVGNWRLFKMLVNLHIDISHVLSEIVLQVFVAPCSE